MPLRGHATARQVRLGTELRRLREAAGLKAREVAGALNSTSAQISQMELGFAGVSEERVRRLAAHYACMDEALIDALVAMATDRTRGWWEEYRNVLPSVFLDTAEAEHHATFLREVVIMLIPGLLQTADYARAVYTYMRPELPESEVASRVEHRLKRRVVIEGDDPTPYETVIHEFALRVHVSDRRASLAQLRYVLDQIDAGHATVRVIPVAYEGFAGAGASMMYLGGPVPRLDTGLRDSPTGAGFCDAEAQLEKLRTLFRQVKSASLDPGASRDLIHRVAKEL
ncbi:MAG: helix-turn-helix domain-containing protein [Streptomyces sp.]|jgi:transcriptional regulator with XRE-family HTH domain|uniref:helix-turn-helix domain-containing protein n=1 Tax=Streptomyces sp. TaxID=1931 RepID=UPI0026001896|nr:helix-turn-helix transcriptional regulator [Streptomyces sp.]MBW8798844.1 helix-turn-helix domain-containing protein [Streptomyces sp.]